MPPLTQISLLGNGAARQIDMQHAGSTLINVDTVTVYYGRTPATNASTGTALAGGASVSLTGIIYVFCATSATVYVDRSASNVLAPTYDRDGGQNGIYTIDPATATTGAALSAQARGGRVTPSRGMAITSIGFAVSTAAGANDNVRVGITDAAGNVVASSAATAGQVNSQGAKAVALSAVYNLAPGVDYYLFVWVGTPGGTAPQIAAATTAHSSVTELFGSGMGVAENFLHSNAAFPTAITRVAATAHPLLVGIEA